jgi:PadR family transcriptional regulator PadR
MLHGLEAKGYLRSSTRLHNGRQRRIYRITATGRAALAAAKVKVMELYGELFE